MLAYSELIGPVVEAIKELYAIGTPDKSLRAAARPEAC